MAARFCLRMHFTFLSYAIIIATCQLYFASCLHVEQQFTRFIDKYAKPYRRNTPEYLKRYSIFQDNLKVHAILNQKNGSTGGAIYGVTKFADLSSSEFRDLYLSSLRAPSDLQSAWKLQSQSGKRIPWAGTTGSLPQKVDWRLKNVVTPVKNQKSCGGCWAFSTVETAESRLAVQTGRLRSLSVQQVLDCSAGFRDVLASCNGGDTCIAFQWMLKTNVSIVDEASYPTRDKVRRCDIKPNATLEGIRIESYTCQYYKGHEDLLVRLIAGYGPITVTVDATSWNNYQGGVIQYHCGHLNNHAVVIVGYDLTGHVPYYIVRNSWGDDFGLDGYLHVKFGDDTCGISHEVSTVQVYKYKG